MAVFGGGGWVVVTRAQSARTAGTQGPGTGRPHVPRCYAAVYGSSARAPADPVVCDAEPARHPILALPSARMDGREKKQRTHAKKTVYVAALHGLCGPPTLRAPLSEQHTLVRSYARPSVVLWRCKQVGLLQQHLQLTLVQRVVHGCRGPLWVGKGAKLQLVRGQGCRVHRLA